MDDDADIDDMYNLSDSSTSRSSVSSGKMMFNKTDHLVLELHELKREAPSPAKPETKTRKMRRKKKPKEPSKQKQASSSSPSEASLKPHTFEPVREEFYDAHESYHVLSEEQAGAPAIAHPVVDATLMEARSEHGPDLKIIPPGKVLAPADKEPPTAIKKPV